MPRPLLEIWRELNRDRDREPSSLLQQALGISRKPPSLTEQAIANIRRELSSPAARERQMLARAICQRPSPVEQAIARIGREMSSPEMREKLRRRQELLELCGVTERVLGKSRPLPPAQPDMPPDKPARPDKRKRRPGGGRHRILAPAEIKRGGDILGAFPGISADAARKTLEEAGIKASTSTVYRYFFKPASGRS
jgi:hypothetical protein